MRLFQKLKKVDGWRAISFLENNVCAAHVRRMPNVKPKVTLALSVAVNGLSNNTFLEKLAKDWHGDRYQCTTLLSAGEYRFLPVDAPQVPVAELKPAISWVIKDMLDFHIDEATVDVLSIPAEKNAPQRNRAMYAVAARSKVIEERQHRFEDAKIPLRVIDIPEMAQRNIAALYEPEGRGLAVLSLGAQGGLLTITAGGELYFARRIDITLDQLLQSGPEKREAYHDRIALEIQRSLDHFGRQYQSITLSKLMLAPMGDDDGGLQAYLAENLDKPVESMNLESVLDFSDVHDLKRPDKQQYYFLTLGAALRLEEKVL